MIEILQSIASGAWGWALAVWAFIGNNSGPISVILALLVAVFGLESKARDAIAAVNEMKVKISMTPEEALNAAADWMGNTKWTGWIPLGVRRWIVQTIFNSMKELVKKKLGT